MTTNDLKKGTRIRLRNGWFATLMDNQRGNIRLADVEGIYREVGSVYAHDIIAAEVNGSWVSVTHTDKQNKSRSMVDSLFH